jgi:S1-C subfamily serine protease
MVRPDTHVKVEVFRNGEIETLKVKIGDQAGNLVVKPGQDTTSELGMTLRSLTNESAEELGLDVKQGVLIEAVDPHGPAAKAGLRANDVIVRVQGREVSSLGQFREKLRKHDLAKGVRLTVRTGKTQRFLFLRACARE